MRRLLFIILFIQLSFTGFSQGMSNKGKEFWLGYCYHEAMINGGTLVMTLYLTSDVNTTYTIAIHNGATIATGNIIANQVVSVVIPNSYFLSTGGLITGRTIKVTAANPIVIYSYITRNAVSGATVCLPKNVLGTDYMAMSFTQNSNQPNSNSYITIIAVEDNTSVEIIPTATTTNGWAAGSVNVITLNKGEIFQVLGTTTGNTGVDLSGTKVRSIAPVTGGCKKIAVFSGAGKMLIGAGGCNTVSNNSSDNLYQQLYPIAAWGKNYLTVPSYNRPNNYYRIWKSTANPTVTLNGTVIPAASFTNGYYQFYNNVPNQITSNDPIAVTQYFTTQGCPSGAPPTGNPTPYDPDMIILNPVEQNIRDVTLISSNLVAAGPEHHLHVIMKNSGTALSSFRFDGGIPAATWQVHPQNSSFSYLYLGNVAQSSHRLYSDSGFNAIAYGYANAESYGYSAGTNVIDLYQQMGTYNPLSLYPTSTSTCVNTDFKFKISLPYPAVSMNWNFHGTHPNATIAAPATPDSVVIVNGVNVYWYSLPGYYNYPTVGTYPVTITVFSSGVSNCGSEQDIDFEMTVNPRPTGSFTFSSPACLSEPVTFTNTVTSVTPLYIWNYNFGDPTSGTSNTSLTNPNPAHTFTSPGTYNVTYHAISEFGCPSDTTTHQVIVPSDPSASISGTANVCVGAPSQTVTFTGTGGVAPYTFTYTVNGGAPQTITTTGTNTTATITIPTTTSLNQTYQLVSVSTGTAASCIKPATGSVNMIVRDVTTGAISGGATVCQGDPSPQVTFTGTTGPLPYTFTYNINGGAPQTISTTASSSTVTLNVPTTNNGTFTYNITNVADAGGVNCIATPSGSATFIVKATPSITFTTSPAILCNTRTITFTPTTSIAAGNVVTWDWDFGDGTTAQYTNGNAFTHNYTTAGIKTVSVTVTSDQGCTKTFTQSITINQRPHAGFISPNVCLADVTGANFIDTSNANGSTITNWNWNFGDPASANNTSTLQNPSHYYNTTGVKDVTLIVTNQGGCTDTLQQQITINGSIPVSNFSVQNLNNLCSNNTVTLTNTSTVDVGNVIKNEIYWDYVNNPAVFETHSFPTNGQVFTHNYPVSNTDRVYRIRYRAFSGITCIDEKIVDITVHAKPQPAFATVAPVCLNNGTIQLTQGSEVNGIAGTGTYSGTGITNPSGTFDPIVAGEGPHTIQYLYVTNFGCKDSITQTVTVLQAPISSFDISNLKCANMAITFTPTATATAGSLTKWVWNYGDSPNNDTVLSNTPVTHTYASANTYTVTLTVITSDGCKSLPNTRQITVNKTPVPQFSFTASACLPQAKIDFTNTTQDLSDYNYTWNFDDPASGSNSANTVNASHIYTAAGPYNVNLYAISAATGCYHDTTIAVNTVHQHPIASFSLSSPFVCIGKSVSFTDNSAPVEGNINSWVWSFGDGNTYNGPLPPSYTYSSVNNYSIKQTVTTNFGCTDDTTINFRVWDYPNADAGQTMFVLEGGNGIIYANATGSGPLSYVWSTIPSGFTNTLSSTTVLRPVVTPFQDMRYLLTTTNPASCTDTSSVMVIVLKNPKIPNTFSPNNDGINDYWVIDFLNTYPQCKVQVFTRTGQKVFESRGYRQPWDGTMNGKTLPMDTYYYIIDAGNGRTPVKGFIQLVK